MTLSYLAAYKLQTQIAKALKTRSSAICTALNTYNRLVKTLNPPRPSLDFKEVLDYSSLAEFDLLRDTRGTVQTRVWAQPAWVYTSRGSVLVEKLNDSMLRLLACIHSFVMMKYRILNVLMPYGILIQASSCNGSAVGPPL